MAVLNEVASNQLTVLFAFARRKVIALGFVEVNTLEPIVVFVKDVPQDDPVETGIPAPG